jgi:hypothetical protein
MDSDDIPSDVHQDAVTALAEEYLTHVETKRLSDSTRLTSALAEHPLLTLEVVDEAIVLHKNRRGLWGNMSAQFSDDALPSLMLVYQRSHDSVTRLRAGRPRNTTTPTLRGGQRRIPQCESGTPSFLPLTNSLRDLRIGYFPALAAVPRRFSDLCCLLRDGSLAPIGDQRKLDRRRSEATNAAMAELSGTSTAPVEGWPADATLALRAVLSLDAGADCAARALALQSLRLNPYCTLALQVLEIDSSSRSSPALLKDSQTASGLSAPGRTVARAPASTKPWWKVW